jgi:hypothetical protein
MTTAVERVRAALAAAMLAAYPDPADTPIVGVLGPTDAPQRATVLVGSSQVTPQTVACPGRTYAVRVWTITPVTAPGAGDAAVDGLLDAALSGLDAAGIGWSDATRGVWAEQYPSYVITVEVIE